MKIESAVKLTFKNETKRLLFGTEYTPTVDM
jgi:hypothetical protein